MRELTEKIILSLKDDIKRFGWFTWVNVWCAKSPDSEIYLHYDFIIKEDPVTADELQEHEYIKRMPMGVLMYKLKRQCSII